MSENSGRFDIDLGWDDSHVMPEVVTPEVEFIFRKMTEVVLAEVNVKPSELVLDVGCGRGLDGMQMSEKGAFVVGLEPSALMLRRACDHISKNSASMVLVRAIGEDLPLRAACVDKVVCKGAIDHFVNPARALEEMARVLKASGRAVIAVANFESLGFKLGRAVYRILKWFGVEDSGFKMPWEVPDDHTYGFDYRLLTRMVNEHFRMERVQGVSLFFGLPWWGTFLARCPVRMAQIILALLDRMARYLPRLGDVIVVTCTRKIWR